MAASCAEEIELLKETGPDHEFLASSYEGLQHDYPNKYVAIIQGKVWAHDPSADAVAERPPRAKRGRALIEFIPGPDVGFALY